MKKLFLTCFLFAFLSSCRSKDGDFNVFSIDEDIRLGKQFSEQFEQLSSSPLLVEDQYPEAYKHLRKITHEIISSKEILHRDEFAWEVRIIEDDSVLNAFCTPGGYIYVYTGLIKFLDSEDELAGVLGHEIAHADLRHSTEQLTKNYGLHLIIKLFTGDAAFLGSIAGNLISLNFSRSDESEADRQSVIYLSDTKYDARGVARFFQKMKVDGNSSSILQFLNTHPNPENRIENIYQEWKLLGSKSGLECKQDYKEFKALLP